MENHAHRAEFVAALNGHVGVDQRTSHTLGISFLYVAAPISGGAARLAYPLAEIDNTLHQLARALLWGSLIACAVAIMTAGAASLYVAGRLRQIVEFAERISAGDLTARIDSRSGDEIGQVAAALDKTARRVEESFARVQTSQRELETLLNSMQDAVIAVDAESRVQWANRGMDRILHHAPGLNKPVIDSLRDPDFLAAIHAAAEGQVVSNARSHTITPGRSFDVTAAPMPGGGAVAVLRDLTETERMEKTRRDFIANVSHELRTPLTSIQGYSETILDSNHEGSQVREFIEIIRKNAARMSRLTEDLLTLARVESGEQRFEIEPVAPEELLEDALESFREVARGYGVDLLKQNAAQGQLVAADREAIHQVFSNLIENALKYAGVGKRVVLGAREAAGSVEFYVQDFGPGISSEHLPRLFERFYRVDKARSRESGGTGLGLAIAKHIVLAHGGSIRAESELNHGSMFLFVLPTSQKPAEV
jgi:two-component system phosphate regulon sensor histidine kinase PhoR